MAAMAQPALDHTYRYRFSSKLHGDGRHLSLATSGGVEEHPCFFEGLLRQPRDAADMMLTLGLVARSRFAIPPALLRQIMAAADPVVTSDGSRLRMESFSACGGVYARADLLEGAIDGQWTGRGTTNVDFNQPLRAALTRLGDTDTLKLSVGPQQLEVETPTASVVERKVPLPVRWLKGFVAVVPRPGKKIPSRYPTVGLHEGSPAPNDEYPGSAIFTGTLMVRAAALVWPLARESYYAEGARRLASNLRYAEAYWDNRLFLEPLLLPHEPLGEMATLALALGLCCKDPGERSLAADVFIAAVEEGRLDGGRLGAALALLLTGRILVPTRLARSLGECARVSALVRSQTCQALQGCLRGPAAGAPRGVHALLELLHELLLQGEAAVTDDGARAFLGGFSGGSKAARLAHKLLKLEPADGAAAHLHAAAAEALQRRLEQAE